MSFNEIFRQADDSESDVQRRIRETRAALEEFDKKDRQRQKSDDPLTEELDDWSQPMPEPLQVGDEISFFGTTVLAVGSDDASSFRSVTTAYGDVIKLDAALLEHNSALWALAHDPEAQKARWRRDMPLYLVGPWPADTPKFERGSWAESVARDEARASAFQISDEAERARELRRIDDLYGLKSTSVHLASYRGDLQ